MASNSWLGFDHLVQSAQSVFTWAVCQYSEKQLLSLHSGAHEPQLLNLCAATAEAPAPEHSAPQQAKSPKCETHTSQLESNPCSLQLEKEPAGSNEDPAQAKINK